MLDEECHCAQMLAAGAYDGWWCPQHKDVRPVAYAVAAARELHGKYIDAANNAFALKATMRKLVDEVKRHAYSPQFEHMGPLVLEAEALLAKGE